MGPGPVLQIALASLSPDVAVADNRWTNVGITTYENLIKKSKVARLGQEVAEEFRKGATDWQDL